MCYFLYLASPLTLSEVRSMLPAGLTADLASFSDQQAMKAIHPRAQTVARILSGRCSCDLVRPRLADAKADERHLRERYRGLGISRAVVIAALERHRQGHATEPGSTDWPAELSRFVVEHARNAGPSLYYLDFCTESPSTILPRAPRQVPSEVVLAGPGAWLHEQSPTLVTR